MGLGTALHEATKAGKPGVVQMLIQKGSDVVIRDSRGNTALEVAEMHENSGIAQLLRNAEKASLAKI